MKTTGANLQVLATSVKHNFNEAKRSYTPLWPKVATLVKSTSSSNHYPWLAEFTRLREWIGEREINRMKMHGYTIINEPFEGTEGIPRSYIEDDEYGVLMPKFQDMGYAAATHPDEKVFALLANGFTEKCYDGQFFFDTDHPVGEEGKEVSVANYQGGSGNAWFLLDTSRPLKPLIYQQRKDYQLISKLDPVQSDHVHMFGEFLFSIDARGNWGFGFWQQAYASKAELNDANFDSAVACMMGFKSNKGRPLGIMPNLLVVGPSNRAAAKKVVEAENKAGGETNTNFKAVEVLVVPWLP